VKVLFDVGACRGDFTNAWLEEHPEGKVYCVEPDPENAQKLRERFLGNNVEIIQKAVWIEDEVRNLWSGTSSENASITVRNESQFENPDIKPTQVECVKLSSLIHNEVKDDKTTTFLKIDVEGVEFRCLQSVIKIDLIPDFVYFEDGCRKCIDMSEWRARVSVYNDIHKKKIQSQFFVEGNTKSSKNYLECYDPLETHQPYQIIRDGQADLSGVVNILFEKAKELLSEHSQIAHQIERVDFLFSWLNCHVIHVHLRDGSVYEVFKENPVNSNKDTDIAIRFIQKVSFKLDPAGRCSSQIDYLSLDECEKEMNVILCKQGRDRLL
tara:strand:+ start:1813 stop:2784 length:972 start_codon:yes stop_codon:yes gene_type:complete